MANIQKTLQAQRDFFNTRVTYDIPFRVTQLKALQKALHTYEDDILTALKKDLNKAPFEAYVSEIHLVHEEITYMIKNIKKLSKPERKKSPLLNFPSSSTIYKEPYGVMLAIAPWNYPIQLSLVPIIGAIATGNCAILKPSNYSANSAKILTKIIKSTFEPNYITTVEGDRTVNKELLDQKFDHIFFTGSPEIGKLVMQKASKHLTPVTLELGGKSPCIVDNTANLELAAKRIAWGKLFNAGQTCIAPDYMLVHESIKDDFIALLKKYCKDFFGETPQKNTEYPKIINQKHFDRLSTLISKAKNVWGGEVNAKTNQIAPSIFDNVKWKDDIMKDEIFGPIFPILTYTSLEEVVKEINCRPKPLAFYVFTTSKDVEEYTIKNISFGGGCVNDTLVHLTNINMGFGGVGNSGMGSYHGRKTFDTLTHTKGTLKKANWYDLPIRYAPYGNKLDWVKKVLKFI